jgi:16S rRNA (guanine(966)-N(2))-methyltransferase RsmD
MRVVSGSAKGRKLKSVPGDSTRPIADRVKVALFDILSVGLSGVNMLDLFAGTGGVGIEALSRGAKRVVLIDKESLAIRTIHENLGLTNLAGKAEVIRTDSFHYLSRKAHPQFDVIYIAPPQYQELWLQALTILDDRPDWLSEDGMAIVQIHPREYHDPSLKVLVEFDRRKYGNTLLIFYERPGR